MISENRTASIILGILILTSSSGFHFGASMEQFAHAEQSKRIIGYFPQWESVDVHSIDYSKVTDIIYFHIWPSSDGSIVTTDVNFNDLNTITDNAHAAGVNVLITVGGWRVSDGFPDMTSDVAARTNFVSNVKNFLLAHNLDGVDVNWETEINQTKINNQDILLSDLAGELHPMGKLVTVAANGEVPELKSSAAGSVDWVNIMAYDMNWGTAEHSTYVDATASLQLYENQGLPKEKLALGIPFYGRDNNTNAIKYQDVVSSCNPSPSENYCNGYFFNGIDLVQQKTQYVLDKGYHGVMVWNLGQDTYDQTSLLNAINDVLDSTPLPDMPPIANEDNYSVESQTTLNEPTPGVLSNDNDPNNDSISAVLDSEVSNGVLTFNSDGSFSYLPNPDFDGIDYFTYHANDGSNDSNVVTVSISVNPVDKVHLENIIGESNGKKRWTGTATITVFDEYENPYPGAVVLGTWQDGSDSSCVTGSQGQCKISQTTRADFLTFTLENIFGSNLSYESNVHDVDNSITIYKDGKANQPPTANAGLDKTVNDSDENGIEDVKLDGSGSGDSDGTIASYEWKDESGVIIGNAVSITTSVPLGIHVYTLTVLDDDGDAGSDSVSITVESPLANQPPKSDAGGPYIGIEGAEITFDGTKSRDPDGSIISYEWDFGDGNTGNGSTAFHTYPTAGTYTVALVVTDNIGETDTDSISVTVDSSSSNQLNINEISPNSMVPGETIFVTILGTGFGTESEPPTVTFGGEKWTPSATITSVNDSQIVLEVWRTSAGPDKVFAYDVTVTNSYGDSVSLPDVFIVSQP